MVKKSAAAPAKTSTKTVLKTPVKASGGVASAPAKKAAGSKIASSKTASKDDDGFDGVKTMSRGSKAILTSGYELIVCEKPSTMEKIAQALADGTAKRHADEKVGYYELTHEGKPIVVCSAVGHLFTVAEKEKSFKYPSYDIEWRLTADVEKDAGFSRKYAALIKRLAKGAKEVTVATDYDIEGETIGVMIVKYLCNKPDANRMKFSTVTAEDLKEAYATKQSHIDWGQANAGTTRHVLDWYYGINVSRALTTSVKTAGSFMILSTGRVQGPALKIIVDREKEIRAFIPQDYWQIELAGEHHKRAWLALHERDRVDEEQIALDILKKCKGKQAIVDTIDRKENQQAAPTPFDLGTLQTESYRAFGISPRDTLAIAQSLYTSAYISYPRTSSQKLPTKIGYRKVLGALAKNLDYTKLAESLLGRSLLTPNEGKKDDPAHPAIYPTGQVPNGLEGRDAKVYDLIVKRFFATFADPAVRETNTVGIVIAGERFICRGTRTIVRGWHEFYDPYVDLKEDELPAFRVHETISYDRLESIKKQTQPPRRYTPASLVTELEKRNLGTKATRAEIVEQLVRRNYLKGQKSFEATELGIKICGILEAALPDIVNVELTQHFEDELEQIRGEEKTSDEVLEEAKETLTKVLTKFRKTEKKTGEGLIEAQRTERDIQETLFQCPVCEQGTLRIRYSPKLKRRFIGCDRYPDCEFTTNIPGFGIPKVADKVCEHCTKPMIAVLRKGPPIIACINPKCPARVKLEAAQSKLAKENGEGTTCKVCGKGKMAVKKGRFGMFLGCDRYPDCKTIVNLPKSKEEQDELEKQKIAAKASGEGKECPTCHEGKLMLRKSARGYFLGCNRYPQCKTLVKIE
jgi:DNA topoisomerase-1